MIENPTGISLKSSLKRFQSGNVYHFTLLQMSEGVCQYMWEWESPNKIEVLCACSGIWFWSVLHSLFVWSQSEEPNVSVRYCDMRMSISCPLVRFPEGYTYKIYPRIVGKLTKRQRRAAQWGDGQLGAERKAKTYLNWRDRKIFVGKVAVFSHVFNWRIKLNYRVHCCQWEPM